MSGVTALEKEGKEDRGSHTPQQLDAQRQKLLLTEAKLKQLQQQQQDMQRLFRMRGKNEQRVVMLEGETERLRNQRERLKRELKDQNEKKTQLESEVKRCRQRLASFELCTNQQRKVLKVKTEEVCMCVCVYACVCACVCMHVSVCVWVCVLTVTALTGSCCSTKTEADQHQISHPNC